MTHLMPLDSRAQGRLVIHGRGRRRGTSLLELVVVLLLLVSLALMTLSFFTVGVRVGGTERNPQEVATLATLQAMREAIAGQRGLLENLAHRPEALAVKTSELVREAPPESVRQRTPELARFHPRLGIGWQGPYLMPSGMNAKGEPTIVDGWGNEIEIQVETKSDPTTGQPFVSGLRLISRGPDGLLQTKVGDLFPKAIWASSRIESGTPNDDVVVSVPLQSLQP